MDLCALYTDKNNGINLYFFSRNPIIFSFQSFYKSKFVSRKNSGRINRNYHKSTTKNDLI